MTLHVGKQYITVDDENCTVTELVTAIHVGTVYSRVTNVVNKKALSLTIQEGLVSKTKIEQAEITFKIVQ